MRNADPLGDGAGIMDVAAGAAGALAVGRSAMIVKLQRDADDVIAGIGQKRRGDRGIDAARHGDDDPRIGRPALDIQYVHHAIRPYWSVQEASREATERSPTPLDRVDWPIL